MADEAPQGRPGGGELGGRSAPFFVLEGLDGCGKTTQAEKLVSWLEGQGQIVRHLREPGGTPLGDSVRKLVLEKKEGLSISRLAELMLYMASRAQLGSEALGEASAAGEAVVLERCYYSSVAYQGRGLGLDESWIAELGRRMLEGHLPDRVILLDLPHDVAMRRVGKTRDRIESRGAEFFAKVRQGFLDQASAEPDRFFVVDATLGPEEVHQAIVKQLSAPA